MSIRAPAAVCTFQKRRPPSPKTRTASFADKKPQKLKLLPASAIFPWGRGNTTSPLETPGCARAAVTTSTPKDGDAQLPPPPPLSVIGYASASYLRANERVFSVGCTQIFAVFWTKSTPKRPDFGCWRRSGAPHLPVRREAAGGQGRKESNNGIVLCVETRRTAPFCACF